MSFYVCSILHRYSRRGNSWRDGGFGGYDCHREKIPPPGASATPILWHPIVLGRTLTAIEPRGTERAEFSMFEYLYRDASNFKQFCGILVTGTATQQEISAIESTLFEGMHFIPEMVGLASLQHRFSDISIVPAIDDHEWHEVCGFEIATDEDIQQNDIVCSITELVGAFCAVRKWDPAFSPIHRALWGISFFGGQPTHG